MKDIERILKHFKDISNIPRGSGNEEEVSKFIEAFGKNLGLETKRDEVNNVIIIKPATPGFENSNTVVVQGHMDMVCEKTLNSNHDFLKDPIANIKDGDFIHADETTLGADNGIAVATAMALLEDESVVHPKLECLFTVEEETTMKGANHLKESDLEGRIILNIDSEEEGELTCSSAGGKLYMGHFEREFTKAGDEKAYKISIKGLLGGHSGVEIHKNKGNAIKLLAEVLSNMDGYRIADFKSGTKNNAIPRSGEVIVLSSDADFESKVKDAFEKVKEAHKDVEGEIIFELEGASPTPAMSEDDSKDFVNYLLELHTGLYSVMKEGFTETSSNLAIVEKTSKGFDVHNLQRSASHEKMDELDKKIKDTSDKYKVKFEYTGEYPAWEYNENSKLKNLAMKLYKDITGKEMLVRITHGGLECGVFSNTFPGVDIISYGPNIFGAHTPKEKFQISSVERVYDYTKELLKNLK